MNSRWLAVVVLLCATCLAQMPPKEELTSTPKFTDDVPHAFQSYTEEQARGAITIVAARSYAVFGYNTPEVRINMPRVSNSSYAEIEFADPSLLNAAGKAVKYELEHGGYEESKFSDEIRFNVPNGDTLISFARAKGHVKVKFPLAVETLTITPASLGPKELSAILNGPYVSFSEDAVQIPDTSFTKLKPVRAYDAAGHLLEAYAMSETGTDDDGVERKRMAFYGDVARLEIDSVKNWAEFDLAYDLTPSPLLPAGHEGENPDSYQK